MATNTPTPDAFKFELTGGNNKIYEVAIFANQIFSTEVGMRSVYREKGGSEWNYLLEPSFFKEDALTEETLLNSVRNALVQISKKIREFFLLDSETDPEPPTELIDRLASVIGNRLQWDVQSNEIKLV